MNVLQKVHHPHAVQFFGAVTKQTPYMIITEFMGCGSMADMFRWGAAPGPYQAATAFCQWYGSSCCDCRLMVAVIAAAAVTVCQQLGPQPSCTHQYNSTAHICGRYRCPAADASRCRCSCALSVSAAGCGNMLRRVLLCCVLLLLICPASSTCCSS